MENAILLLLDVLALWILVSAIERCIVINNKFVAMLAAAITLVVGYLTSIFTKDSFVIEIVFMIEAIVALLVVSIGKIKILRLCIDYIISMLIVSVIEGVVVLMIPVEDQRAIIGRSLTLLLVLVISALYVYVFKQKIDFTTLPKKMLISLGIMFFCLVVLVAGLAVYSNVTDSDLPSVLILVAVIVCVTVSVVAVEGIMNEVIRLNLAKENEILQNYNDQQEKYYELVLKSEEDTRRFRHDMLNHMICLDEYLNQEKIEDCKEYISNITNSLNISRKKLYHTGNRIADVMLTNLLVNKAEDVEVSVVGQLKDSMGITDYDLCIVISNIVKNAVEAVNNQQEGNKYIKIKFAVGKKYLRIEERNSIDESQIDNAKKFVTAKTDKRHHGLGVKNVKMIVEKYNGSFKSDVKDKEFYVCVEMEMKNDK